MNNTRENASTVRGDVFGGITAGIVALPLALAFGVQSGMGAQYGLYGAIFIGFFAAVLGGTPVQISGPTGPMTVVTVIAVKELAEATGGLEAAMPALVATFVLAGLIQIGMGLAGIGSLIKFIPYPVVSGFMSGIGVIIILLQLFPGVGMPNPEGGTVGVLRGFGGLPAGANVAALALTLATIAIIYTVPRLTKAVPSALVALLALTVVSAVSGIDVPVIGDIPRGFPELRATGLFDVDPELLPVIARYAATLAALGAIDSLLTSVVADNLTKSQHDGRRELIGQGIGNSISGMFAALPGAGATMRTIVNVNAGGKTRLSGAIHSLLLLAVLLGAGAYAAFIPKPVLAGILITVGIGILDYHGMLHVNKVPRSDAAVMLVVLLITVFSSLLVAVGVGMVIACVLFMKRMSEIVEQGVEVGSMRTYQDDHRWPDEQLPAEIADLVIVKRLTGPLFFGFASKLQDGFAQLPDARFLILRMKRVPFVDQSGLYALQEAIRLLQSRGFTVLITGLQSQPLGLMRRVGAIPNTIPEADVVADFGRAVNIVRERFRAQAATP